MIVGKFFCFPFGYNNFAFITKLSFVGTSIIFVLIGDLLLALDVAAKTPVAVKTKINTNTKIFLIISYPQFFNNYSIIIKKMLQLTKIIAIFFYQVRYYIYNIYFINKNRRNYDSFIRF